MLICYELYISKYGLETSYYSLSTDRLTNPIRIVQLTDLHDSVFGRDNEKLVKRVAAENPDIILITGDLVDSHNGKNDTSIATSLISDLKNIADVYVSLGNQEFDIDRDVQELYAEAGAVVLDKEYLDNSVNGQNIRIGGIYGYCQTFSGAQETRRLDEADFLMDFQDTDNYKILMCHMPVCWVDGKSLYEWDVDAVFAGHAHGGQVRIPFKGGLWAPDQGWFPGELCGVYSTNEKTWQEHRTNLITWLENNGYDAETEYYRAHSNYIESNLILSRGLGNTDKVPRFNNVPEIVVTDIVPNGEKA